MLRFWQRGQAHHQVDHRPQSQLFDLIKRRVHHYHLGLLSKQCDSLKESKLEPLLLLRGLETIHRPSSLNQKVPLLLTRCPRIIHRLSLANQRQSRQMRPKSALLHLILAGVFRPRG
jgi:hypothetical protein